MYPSYMEKFHPFTTEVAQAGIPKRILINVYKYDGTINLSTHVKAYLI